MDDVDVIQKARESLESDHMLSLYMIRDLEVTKSSGLHDLVWDGCKTYMTDVEVESVLDDLEEILNWRREK